ncbi:Ubiquinone biosynthesis monooxygenase COQ6 [Colletotrichum shisoi]|uniref:Ubiquinone biosynthesis monooxygenase COQ6, mitochondrial n=1 Tax=Colletotrichum shisoi TaxID=2078593 RepID=A0A5Q4C6H6_9PEZI|nr:Ubiquinone biosynthesis monooxygenase COQ6 [Colletotrichum shisoi]
MAAPRALLARKRFVCQTCTRKFQIQAHRFYASASATSPAAELDIYDVVCVGAGPAGLSLLTALRSNPVTCRLRVALVEAQDLSKLRTWNLPSGQYSNRCSSLTPTSASYLNTIGAWRHIKRERIQDYNEMQVWDGVSGARIEFDWPAGTSAGKTIAYMCENLNLTSGLLSRLEELGGVSVFDGAKVENINFGEETEDLDLTQWPVIHLSGGKQLHARLLVGADGANSPVRTFAGIKAQGWDYGRHGVVATLQMDGPVAMLPLPGNYSTLVWSTTPSNASLLKSLSPKDFVAMVNAAFRLSPVDLEFMHKQQIGQSEELAWRLEHTFFDHRAIPQQVIGVQEGTVASFPLKMRHADTYTAERIALVGDAAHTIHPLAGQGLNQGQGDIQSLVKTIEKAVSTGQDLGSTLSLEAYNAERYVANHIVLGVCDKLHKLYSVDSGPLVPLRSLGLSAVNALGPLKRFFMDQASTTGAKLF